MQVHLSLLGACIKSSKIIYYHRSVEYGVKKLLLGFNNCVPVVGQMSLRRYCLFFFCHEYNISMVVKAQIEIYEMDPLFFSFPRGNAKRYLSMGCLSLSSFDAFLSK